MNRRSFLVQSAAFALIGSAPAAVLAQRAQAPVRFRPTRFSVQVRGRGRDVILIPGLTSGRHVWEEAVRAVPGYRYHLVQVSGFAGEPVRGNAQGPVVGPLTTQIARYIEAEGLRRPAVVGHSMGGTVAMMLAARYPDRVGKLMVVDMMPRPTALYGGSAASQLATGLRDIIGDPQGRQFISSIISAFSPPEDEGRGSNADVVARAMHDLGTIDLTGDLPRIRAPLTIVYAVRDEAGRAATDSSFARAYRGARGARLVRIDDSGHLIMADQPQRFARTMREFLD
ncbi:MAG TPA: alpha/beta hydrolase [Allosphingosinicella sp.]|jgi:pimeloyl-ACP methyl ester carboxylesterase